MLNAAGWSLYWLTILQIVGYALSITVIESPVDVDTVIYNVDRGNSHATAKLTCHNFKDRAGANVRDILWQYKRCGYGLNLTLCDELPDDAPWREVLCRNQTKLCTASTLHIFQPSENDSGLYRCLHKYYMMSKFQINRAIQLIVKDNATRSIEMVKEEFHVDNQTVLENSTVVLRCRVRSVTPPSIVWARPDLADVAFNQTLINVQGTTYEILNVASIHRGPDKMYTSKVNIWNTKLSDSGVYFCIALDEKQNVTKQVSLTVLPLNTYSVDIDSRVYEYWWIAFALILSGTSCILIVCFIIQRGRRKVEYVQTDSGDPGEYLSSTPMQHNYC